MSLRISLTETDREIEKKINRAIAEEMNARVRKNAKKAELRIMSAIPGWLSIQPEVQSILDEGLPNSLNAQFGLNPGQGQLAVAEIVNAVVSSLEVKVKQVDKNLRGGVDFMLQPENLRNLLGLPSGTIVDDDSILPWLEWLLTAGTATIVYGYSYTPDFSGRSGGGSMSAGGVWRIPPQYAGTLRDNFVTRALSHHDRTLKTILQDILND